MSIHLSSKFYGFVCLTFLFIRMKYAVLHLFPVVYINYYSLLQRITNGLIYKLAHVYIYLQMEWVSFKLSQWDDFTCKQILVLLKRGEEVRNFPLCYILKYFFLTLFLYNSSIFWELLKTKIKIGLFWQKIWIF